MMVGERLAAIRQGLPQGVRLVAVSKYHPVAALREAYDAGQRLFGENRPQELSAKVPAMPADTEWHFIGHLQTNKLKLVLPYAAMVQSIDSVRLFEAVDTGCRAAARSLDILLELHIGAEATKHGLTEDEILALCARGAAGTQQEGGGGVRIRGLMGMATHTDDEGSIRAEFARIAALRDRLRLPELSIGMSSDYRLALEYGATLIRLGTAVFGPREY